MPLTLPLSPAGEREGVRGNFQIFLARFLKKVEMGVSKSG